ncbi:mitochondrial import receptor subunit TOM40 homolog isoform X2 [Patagioenas fasciata]|uniref:mitochondrial import receptor subunit TOM40 homolog isoform X2 n=1 Tax=Patagioenas fasciata TaxID=372321 RepID=UPI003A995C86
MPRPRSSQSARGAGGDPPMATRGARKGGRHLLPGRGATAKWARLSAPTNRNAQRGAVTQSERGGRGFRVVSSALLRTPQPPPPWETSWPLGRPPPPLRPPRCSPCPPRASLGSPPPGLGVTPGPNQRGSETGGDPLPNPGAFEECHRKCKELFPVQMEGVKLTVNKGLSNHFQVNHTVALSTLGESNYHFGATYVGTKQLSPTEAFPVLVGDMDNSGSLNAQVIHQLTARLRSKVAFQTQGSKFVNWQLDGEYRGGDFTAAVTLGNPDILLGSGILVAHYLQSVTPSLALGGELVYHRRPGEEGTVLSMAARYAAPNWIGTLTLGQAGAHATYYHRANEQLQVGVELEASARLRDTSVTFGYQLELPRGHLLFRGSLDSTGLVGAVPVHPSSPSLVSPGSLDSTGLVRAVPV